jgi:hypothetical protein
MRANLKRRLLWSSLGGVALGAAVALLRSARKPVAAALVYERIPAGCKRIILWTERFEIEGDAGGCVAHDEYLLQSTPFKLWNVLDLNTASQEREGSPIYHATIVRFMESKDSGIQSEPAKTLERLYGTVAVFNAAGRSPGKDFIARGGILELQKCLVGGAQNGIETGEIHRSAGRILNYRFEYSSADEKAL